MFSFYFRRKKEKLKKSFISILMTSASYPVIPRVIEIEKDQKVFAFSDIHADLELLIVLLRDCAGVIEGDCKGNVDEEVDQKNFRWCGGNAIVVIVGDLIDGKRVKGNNKNFIAGRERRLFEFLTYLTDQATEDNENAGVYIILGNHEWMNIYNPNNYKQYFFQDTSYPPNTKYSRKRAKQKQSGRQTFFQSQEGQQWLRLKKHRRLRLCVQIGTSVFVHAQLPHQEMDVSFLDKCNSWLNGDKLIQTSLSRHFNDIEPFVFLREWGSTNDTDSSERDVNNQNFCKKMHSSVNHFFPNSNPLRVVIGHTPQIGVPKAQVFGRNSISSAFADHFTGATINTGTPKEDWISINFECHKPPTLFKVDVYSSRSFDPVKELPQEEFTWRLPQLLHICDENVSVIRVKADRWLQKRSDL